MLLDEGRFLHITIADDAHDSTFFVNKGQIRKIDMPNNNMVRICVGDNPAQAIIITAGDVAYPSGLVDSKQVLDYLVQISKAGFTDIATASNQEAMATMMDDMNTLLSGIYQALSVYNPANVFNQPLIMDNAVAGAAYYGYAVAGTAVNAAGWAIKKVVVSGGNTNILWASGNMNLANVWNNRASFTYSAISIP
jgi:hypothetical protein